MNAKKIIALVLSIIHFSITHSQIMEIGSFELFPESPALDDTIKLQLRVDFYSAECHLNDYSVEINEQENRLRIVTCYFNGPLATFSHTIDTLTLGILGHEEYDVKLIAGVGGFTANDCHTFWDMDSVNFSINPLLGTIVSTKEINFAEHELKISTNPIGSQIYIENNLPNSITARLFELSGIELKNKYIEEYSTGMISLRGLNRGLYICALFLDNQIVKTELVLK